MQSVVSLLAAGAAVASAQLNLTNSTTTGYINYTTVTGYFLQDEATTNATSFDYVRTVRS